MAGNAQFKLMCAHFLTATPYAADAYNFAASNGPPQNFNFFRNIQTELANRRQKGTCAVPPSKPTHPPTFRAWDWSNANLPIAKQIGQHRRDLPKPE